MRVCINHDLKNVRAERLYIETEGGQRFILSEEPDGSLNVCTENILPMEVRPRAANVVCVKATKR